MVDIYLRISEILEKEVDGGEYRCSGVMKNGVISGWHGLAEVGLVGMARLRVCMRRYEVGWCFLFVWFEVVV